MQHMHRIRESHGRAKTPIPSQGLAKEEALLTKPELAEQLQISPRSLDRGVAERRIPAPMKIGRLVRWRRVEIERWLDAGCPAMADAHRAGVEVSQ